MASINRKRDFHLMMAGRFISGTGSFFNMVAVNLFILLKTGSPALTGMAMAVRILVASVVSPYLGGLADRMDRKKGMIVSDAVLAAAMISLALLPDGVWMVPAIFIVQALLGVFQNFFMINFQAALPLLAPEKNLVFANSYFQIVNSATLLIGSIAAAFAIDVAGYRWAFAADGISYLVSFAILLFLPIITSERKEGRAKNAVGDGFARGVRFIVKTAPYIFVIFIVRWLDGVGSGSHNVALPVFSEIVDAARPNRAYGVILAAWSLGGILSALWMNRRGKLGELRTERIFFYSTLGMSIFWIAVFQTQMAIVFIAAAAVAGFMDTLASVSYSIILQRSDDAVRGRVMALSTMAMMSGFGGGMFFSSLMTGTFSPAALVAIWHGIPIVFITIAILFNKLRGGNWMSAAREEECRAR